MRIIYLIGFMGTGKSSVAKLLSEISGIGFFDTDQLIEAKANMSVSDFFDAYGEEEFRKIETEVLRDISNDDNQKIVSCGGGLPLKEENCKLMKKSGKTILLTASPETVFNRIANNKERPLLRDNMNADYIEEMMEKRKDAYLKASDYIIYTDGKTPKAIAEEITELL